MVCVERLVPGCEFLSQRGRSALPLQLPVLVWIAARWPGRVPGFTWAVAYARRVKLFTLRRPLECGFCWLTNRGVGAMACKA